MKYCILLQCFVFFKLAVSQEELEFENFDNAEVMVSKKNHHEEHHVDYSHGGYEHGGDDYGHGGGYGHGEHKTYTVHVEHSKKRKEKNKKMPHSTVYHNNYYSYPKYSYPTYSYPHHEYNTYKKEEKKYGGHEYGQEHGHGYGKHDGYVKTHEEHKYGAVQKYGGGGHGRYEHGHSSSGHGGYGHGSSGHGGYGHAGGYGHGSSGHGGYAHAGGYGHASHGQSGHGGYDRYHRSPDTCGLEADSYVSVLTPVDDLETLFRQYRFADAEAAVTSPTEELTKENAPQTLFTKVVDTDKVRTYRSADGETLALVTDSDKDSFTADTPQSNDFARVQRSADVEVVPVAYPVYYDDAADALTDESNTRVYRSADFEVVPVVYPVGNDDDLLKFAANSEAEDSNTRLYRSTDLNMVPVVYPVFNLDSDSVQTFAADLFADDSHTRSYRAVEEVEVVPVVYLVDDEDLKDFVEVDDHATRNYRAADYNMVPVVQYVYVGEDGSLVEEDADESDSKRVYRSTDCTFDSLDDEQVEYTFADATCRQVRATDNCGWTYSENTEDDDNQELVRNYRATGCYLTEDPTVQLYQPVDACNENEDSETAFSRPGRDTDEQNKNDTAPETETGSETENEETQTRLSRSVDNAESFATPVLTEVRYHAATENENETV